MNKPYKVLHVNSYDRGGAANACIRLHNGLRSMKVESKVLLKEKTRFIPDTYKFTRKEPSLRRIAGRFRRVLYELRLSKNHLQSRTEYAHYKFNRRLPPGFELFSFPESDIDITTSPLYKEADIINLHWVSGFLDYRSFFKSNAKPIVWTLHDLEPFQGGLHYSENFYHTFETDLIINELDRISKRNMATKNDALKAVDNIHIVGPSRWLTEMSRKSELFGRLQHYTIPYGLDKHTFNTRDKNYSRQVLGLPVDKRCLLFVADNLDIKRKGLSMLVAALAALNREDIIVCAVGSGNPDIPLGNFKFFGRIEDERHMSIIYSAADAFILPSLEDNLPNTALEALMCGTPVIGYSIGGIPDIIRHGANGFISPELTVGGLTESITKYLNFGVELTASEIRHEAVLRFDESVQASAYHNLYERIYQSA